jgi:malonyl-CoA O-methyltransferase
VIDVTLKRVLGRTSRVIRELVPARPERTFRLEPNTPAARALKWIRDNHLPTGGIRAQSGYPDAYPEVTGHTVPTLLEYGERELAVELVNWLLCIQRADGSFSNPVQGENDLFNTGQVLRGLLAARDLVPRAVDAARRTADYLCSQMIDGGAGGFPPCFAGSDCPETVHLYVLPPLLEAAELFDEAACRDAAKRCRDFYLRHSDLLQMDTLTHFLAYEIEALIDLHHQEPARPVLDRLQNEQKSDGSIRGKSDVDWVCIPGLAQLAICWYKLDRPEPADKAVAWLDAHQRPNGGFRGSLGSGAKYKQDVEVGWATKFYLDAHLLRAHAFLSRHSREFSQPVSPDDAVGRLVLSHLDDGNRVLEADYGKGRLLELIQAADPSVECVAPDLVPPSASGPVSEASTGIGSIESLPFDEDSFDVVISAEAVNYSVNPRRAVLELVRVARPGGQLIIIDRPSRRAAASGRPTWLQPPDVKWLASILRHGCDQVAVEPIGRGGKSESDDGLVAWTARKRSPLTGAQWNSVLISSDAEDRIVNEIQFNRLSEWARAIVVETEPGETVLEIGSGTAEISLQMARAGRVVTCLDTDPDSLAFAQRCAEKLGLKIETTCADATRPLPFSDDEFDCVWSSGLLEHFDRHDRRAMLTEWGRVCRGRMVHLVPNASCLAYRVGKMMQEREGIWPYGLEMPQVSLADDFRSAGFEVIREFSVAHRHALNFLTPRSRSIRKFLARLWTGDNSAETTEWNQGYLLVTIGKKTR